MASQQSEEYKDDLGPAVDELFDFLDSDDEHNNKYNSATPGLIHVINGLNGSDSNEIPIKRVKSKVLTSNISNNRNNMDFNDIVSSLYDMRSYINDTSKGTEYERLMHGLLLKFDDLRTEKFNLMQQIYQLEKENDELYEKTQLNNNNNNKINRVNDEYKDIEFRGLETEQSVILVDYCNDNNNKSCIASWTKFYQRHKKGIGEDLRIAMISSQKLKDVKTYNDDHFIETLQSIELKCYFPKLFKKLRQIYGISSLQDFLSSFKANHLLEINESSSSLSGSSFFYSFDGKYIIKSMRKEEVTFVKQMIYKYYSHIEDNKNKSLLSKFCAMFKIVNKQINDISHQHSHFMIMNCVYYEKDFCVIDKPLLIYDLKGSKYNRITEKQNNYQFNISILKDNEWMDRGRKLDLKQKEANIIKQQLIKDVQFLKSMEIMDYSLLIALYQNDGNIQRKKQKETKYFIGMIDFLQHYTYWKQVEANGAYFVFGIDGYDIVDPEHYGNRLIQFVTNFVV